MNDVELHHPPWSTPVGNGAEVLMMCRPRTFTTKQSYCNLGAPLLELLSYPFSVDLASSLLETNRVGQFALENEATLGQTERQTKPGSDKPTLT